MRRAKIERESWSAVLLRQASLDVENWFIEMATGWTRQQRREKRIDGYLDFDDWLDDQSGEQQKELRAALGEVQRQHKVDDTLTSALDAIRRAGNDRAHERLYRQPVAEVTERLQRAVSSFPLRVFDPSSDSLVEVPRGAAESVAKLYLAVRAARQ